MNRKQFIESQGATCNNWNWSWSFINKKEKIIIFGAWDVGGTGDKALILSPSWKKNDYGRRSAGYSQSVEHLRLIIEEGYKLKTFKIYLSNDKKDKQGLGPAKISKFDQILEDKILGIFEDNYYAYERKANDSEIPDEIIESNEYVEGLTKTISINAYERNPEARKKCIEIYGYKCQVCNVDFEKIYGEIGKSYIHVHHKTPLYKIKTEYIINPENDLIPLCPNCHSMIHRTKEPLTVETLKEFYIQNNRYPPFG